MAAMVKVLPSHRLTLKDRLSRLTFAQACKLLGPKGRELITRNGNTFSFDLSEDAHLGPDHFRLRFSSDVSSDVTPIVTITLMAEAKDRLHLECSSCGGPCRHQGATLSLLLEDKVSLGLAAPPAPRKAVESLSEDALLQQAINERAERARTERMTVRATDPDHPWTDYHVTNRLSGKTYRVALRGLERGESYCDCPDFKTNTLGVCKHIFSVLTRVKRRFSRQQLARRRQPHRLSLYLKYADEVTLRLAIPPRLGASAETIVAPLRDRAIDDIKDLFQRISQLQRIGYEVNIYPDAEEHAQRKLLGERLGNVSRTIRANPARHPLRETLLKAPLLPYQLDGIAFAVGAKRAILADDMGLGKTIQGVGVAELLAREAGIRKVLVITPASLKSQWRAEIHRFCDRDVQIVQGSTNDRQRIYGNDCFFTVCNYEQVLRDLNAIDTVSWDLIILDEGQRIKNWETRTARVIKSLRSRFALVLSGTPLENRLDDLFSIAQFVDDRHLGPGFRFFNSHRVVDEKGRVLGYKNLDELRRTLQPILLRRTRESVRLELPDRTTEFVRIAPAEEQINIHVEHMRIVSRIVRKSYINEMDMLRLRQALLRCRMAADSTYLVDRIKPGYSTKLERLDELFESLFAEEGRKVIVFSEWTTMLDLIEPLLSKRRLRFVRLDGSVPQRQRQELVHEFQTSVDCRLFLTTNAGSTGLNLQSANTVINVDLPWNPAVLEQRIARAHRMGQKQPVQVFVLVTEQTIEENLLATLAAKKDLALAALDADSTVDQVDIVSGVEELKSRLEVLLGARCEAPLDKSMERTVTAHSGDEGPRERVADAGGKLLTAALGFLGELAASAGAPAIPVPEELVDQFKKGLNACVEDRPEGGARLTIPLPDRGILDQLARTLASFLAVSAQPAHHGNGYLAGAAARNGHH